jgi:hypothetical protein
LPKLVVCTGADFCLFGIEFNEFLVTICIVGNSALRAFGNANTAIDTSIRINNQLAVAFMKSVNRAYAGAGFALNAAIVYY